MRHFTKISNLNHHIERGMYPLGSCTMKYNPRLNEQVAAMPGFAALHPEQGPEDIQGLLAALKLLEDAPLRDHRLRGLQPDAGRRRPRRVPGHAGHPRPAPRRAAKPSARRS